jgi:choline dehydrogenase-like flavoprotein
LGLSYEVGLGNERAGIISRAGDTGNVNNNRAWVARVFARPAGLTHLQFGGAVYRDEITPFHVVDSNLRVCGIENLRIADGSTMPRVTTGATPKLAA